MPSTPNSPTRPSPSDLQSHLYASFLQRKTADVALRISGSWHAIYRLHRVILIQAGFFQSLFTSGFSESTSRTSNHRAGQEYIDIVFDDPNITRAAFETCIARLYGGGPTLWISPSRIPTATHPLTPSFASAESDDPSASSLNSLPPHLDISSAPTLPPGHHTASPRFLLSLLVTAGFLSIPSVASQALSAIVRTVGPHTAVRYLNFAIGKGIGPPNDPGTGHEGLDHESQAAAGLENVAELVPEEDTTFESINFPIDLQVRHAHEEDSPAGTLNNGKKEVFKHSYGCGPPDSDSESDPDAEERRAQSWLGSIREKPVSTSGHCHGPCYYYGAVSDKVGEAAACWLTRWGIDMLRYEEQAVGLEQEKQGKSREVPWSSVPPQGQRPGSAPPEMPGSRSSGKVGSMNGKPVLVPVIWRRGGLNARWARGILSSDALFVRGEKERYEMARSVVEMRRGARATDPAVADEGEDVEEAEFLRLFNEGIYYANMHLDDLMAISRDVSPSTGKPIIPLAVLQAALWNQSTLYHRITQRPAGTSSPSVSPTVAKELGISTLSGDIEKLALHPDERGKLFYPVPSDSSHRLGDNTGIEGASMDQLFDVGNMKKNSSQANEANFFSLEQTFMHSSAVSLVASSSPPVDPEAKWTAHPPFRFSVEFWDVDALKEKSRLHSHTVWYAGSLYNVYVQVVRKKGIQLGIYLHRQSTADPLPPMSAPVSGVLPPPPRDRGVVGRGSSSSVSSPRSPLDTTLISPISPIASSASMSSLARMTVVTAPASPATPSSATSSIFSSFPSGSSFSSSSTTAHSHNSVGIASSVTLPATATPIMPPQPYRDPRPAVGAYFTIACASATGASLTRFTSAPDTFSVSQSWGWKSSSLRTEEYVEFDVEGQLAPVAAPAGREASLRATVVLGLV